MKEKELSAYRMNVQESEEWYALKKRILHDCKNMQIPHRYYSWIDKKTDPIDPYNHVAGYSQVDGYFYVEEGDRGEIALTCCSHDFEDIRWYLLTSIVSYVGQKYEHSHRNTDEKRWRYSRKFKNGKLKLKQRFIWKYNAIHDTRKLWFEYEINALTKVADKARLAAFVDARAGLLNLWYDQPHWAFEWKDMVFVEISDSREHD